MPPFGFTNNSNSPASPGEGGTLPGHAGDAEELAAEWSGHDGQKGRQVFVFALVILGLVAALVITILRDLLQRKSHRQ